MLLFIFLPLLFFYENEWRHKKLEEYKVKTNKKNTVLNLNIILKKIERRFFTHRWENIFGYISSLKWRSDAFFIRSFLDIHKITLPCAPMPMEDRQQEIFNPSVLRSQKNIVRWHDILQWKKLHENKWHATSSLKTIHLHGEEGRRLWWMINVSSSKLEGKVLWNYHFQVNVFWWFVNCFDFMFLSDDNCLLARCFLAKIYF